MANAIQLTQLMLYDNWPGAVNPNLGIPRGGFDATEWNLCTTDDTAAADTPPYPIGTKIMAYTDNSNCPGWYTMMYLAFHDYSSRDIEAKDVSLGQGYCCHVNVGCSTKTTFYAGGNDTVAPYYFVAQCCSGQTDVTEGAPIAMPCATLSADSSIVLSAIGYDNRVIGYGHGLGWFWVGGVCPVKDLTHFDHSSGGHGGTNPYIGADVTAEADMRPGPVNLELTTDQALLSNNACMSTGSPMGWACSSG